MSVHHGGPRARVDTTRSFAAARPPERSLRAASTAPPAAGATVHGVSARRPHEQEVLAEKEGVRFPLLFDVGPALTAAQRLPTFRAAGATRPKRPTPVAGRGRTVAEALPPVTDCEACVRTAHAAVRRSAE